MRLHLSPGLSFALRFFAYLLLSSVVFWALSLHEPLGLVQRAIASLSAAAQRGVGGDAMAQGADIVVKTLTLNVNHECTGIFVCILFPSFLLAYPASWSARFTGIAIGIPLFFTV